MLKASIKVIERKKELSMNSLRIYDLPEIKIDNFHLEIFYSACLADSFKNMDKITINSL